MAIRLAQTEGTVALFVRAREVLRIFRGSEKILFVGFLFLSNFDFR